MLKFVTGFSFSAIPKVLVSRDKIAIACISVFVYLVLDYSYIHILEPNFEEFIRFKSGDPSLLTYGISFLLPLFLTCLLIVLPTSELIYCILCLILVLIIYPSTILLRHLNANQLIVSLNLGYFIAVYVMSRLFTKSVNSPILQEHQKTPILLGLGIACITPFLVTFGPYIDLNNLVLSNIYGSREIEARLSNRFMDYAYSALTNVILPLLLIISILHKKFLKTTIAITMLLFMFLVGGHKSVFFATFLLIYFYYGNYSRKIKYFFLAILLVLCSVAIYYYQSHDLFLFALITRRIFFIPAILDIGYFDFFRGHPIFWSDSILRSVLEYPFELLPRNLIGRHVLLNPFTNANSGIISDGFMNFGIIGSVINIFFVSCIFAILNTLNLSHRFFGLIFLLFFTFLSTYFFTTMITHGGLLFLVLAHLFLKNSRSVYHA